MSKNSLLEKLKTFENCWVALTKEQDRVITDGKSLKETIENVKAISYKDPIYFFIPSQKHGYAPACK